MRRQLLRSHVALLLSLWQKGRWWGGAAPHCVEETPPLTVASEHLLHVGPGEAPTLWTGVLVMAD